MPKVTLIGKELAEKNGEFVFLGPLQDCKDCKLTHICFNLKPYHRYRIVKIRKKRHNCNVHQSNSIVVEVEELPLLVSIDKKLTKGSTTTLNNIPCDQKLCRWYDFCQAPALKPDRKYKIGKIVESDINCRKKHALQLAEVTE